MPSDDIRFEAPGFRDLQPGELEGLLGGSMDLPVFTREPRRDEPHAASGIADSSVLDLIERARGREDFQLRSLSEGPALGDVHLGGRKAIASVLPPLPVERSQFVPEGPFATLARYLLEPTQPDPGGGVVLVGLGTYELSWTMASTLSANQNNLFPKYRVKQARTLRFFDGQVISAPTGQAIVVNFRKNGVTVYTLTISAGQSYAESTEQSVAVAVGDDMTVDISQVGSVAPGETIYLRARA